MRDQKHSWLPAALDLTIFYWVQFPDDLVLSISLPSLARIELPNSDRQNKYYTVDIDGFCGLLEDLGTSARRLK